MKTFYFTLFLFVSILILAHDDVPFVQEGKTWIFEHETTTGTEVSYSNYMMKGDTIINGLQYKRLFRSGNFCGAFRQSGMKVYYFSPSKNSESLSYDFGLRKDDIIANPEDNQNWRTMTFDSISSVGRNLYKWGLYYDPTVHDTLVYTYWIEGVGSLHGPTLSFDPNDGSWTTLRSCQTGDDIIYSNESQSHYTESTIWHDGYFDEDNGIVINRHAACGDTLIQGRKYHKMSVFSSKIQNSYCTCTRLSYFLAQEQNGNLWFYTDDERVFNLYKSDPDGLMGKSLVGKELFLFNAKSSRQVCIAYGKAYRQEDGNYIWEKRKTWISGDTGVVDFISSRRSTPETPDLIAGVGWAGYGPLWGLGEPTTGKRFYLTYFEGSNLLYEDTEQKTEVEKNFPGIMNILSETYKPFLQGNPIWVFKFEHLPQGDRYVDYEWTGKRCWVDTGNRYFTYYFLGKQKKIDGKTYTMIGEVESGNKNELSVIRWVPIREEGGLVYAITDSLPGGGNDRVYTYGYSTVPYVQQGNECILYNFNLQIGDNVPDIFGGDNEVISYGICQLLDGSTRRVFVFCQLELIESLGYIYCFHEGITNPLFKWETATNGHMYSRRLNAYFNEWKMLYKTPDAREGICMNDTIWTENAAWEYAESYKADPRQEEVFTYIKSLQSEDITGVSNVPSTQSPHYSPLYDLQGRQLQHEPTHGVFIKDGRKWVK